MQPGGQVVLAQLAGGVLRPEAGQERQADLAVQLREQPDGAGKRPGEMGTQLVARRDPVRHQVTAGAHGRPQGSGRGRVHHQRTQPGAIRAQRVSQHERVEPVVLDAS